MIFYCNFIFAAIVQLNTFFLLIYDFYFSSFVFIVVLGNVVMGFDSHLRGPAFVMEPPTRLEFSNSSGGWLDCSASGSPQPTIDWLSVDGTSVGDVSGIRRVLRNGTLVLLPFAAAAYRQDIHSTVYRCVSSNTVGRIISRDVQVRAGNVLVYYTILLLLCRRFFIFIFKMTKISFQFQFKQSIQPFPF